VIRGRGAVVCATAIMIYTRADGPSSIEIPTVSSRLSVACSQPCGTNMMVPACHTSSEHEQQAHIVSTAVTRVRTTAQGAMRHTARSACESARAHFERASSRASCMQSSGLTSSRLFSTHSSSATSSSSALTLSRAPNGPMPCVCHTLGPGDLQCAQRAMPSVGTGHGMAWEDTVPRGQWAEGTEWRGSVGGGGHCVHRGGGTDHATPWERAAPTGGSRNQRFRP
jgi:hypothetical protein